MFKQTGENSFAFVGEQPLPLLARSTEKFWHVIEPGESLLLLDSAGMPIQYSNGRDSWYVAHCPELFVMPEPAKVSPKKDTEDK